MEKTATYWAKQLGLPPRGEDETERNFIRRVVDALREGGRVVDALELHSGHRIVLGDILSPDAVQGLRALCPLVTKDASNSDKVDGMLECVMYRQSTHSDPDVALHFLRMQLFRNNSKGLWSDLYHPLAILRSSLKELGYILSRIR